MYSLISYEYIFWNDYHNRFSWYPSPRIVGNSIFLVMRTFNTWCCNFQIYIIINFRHHAVHYIPQELSYNWKSVPLTTFTHFTHPQPLSSVSQLCPTLCDPMNRSTPGLPVHHQLPEFTQTHAHWVGDAIQPSHPLSSPCPPAPNPSQHQSLFQWVNSSYEVAKVLEFQL